MPHIVSLPVGYMNILGKNSGCHPFVCSEKRCGLLFLQKMVITPATKMMTLETMMTMPWWRASRTRPRETILIFNVQICIKDILKQFICKNIIFRLWWMTSCLPPSQYFFYSQVNGNHHQQETTLEQRPPLRKSHRDFIDNSLFWTRSSSHRCWDLKLKGTIYGSLDDLVVSIGEEDIPLFFNSLDIFT